MELTRLRLAFALAIVASLAGCKNSDDGAADLGMEEQIGKEFVAQRNCAMCHQSANASDGTLAGQSTPQPGTMAYGGNLTPDVTTGLGAWADIEIVRAMRYGIDNQQEPLCPTMPHYDGTDPSQPAMTDVEADAIVAYLRSLPSVANKVPASMCPPIKPPPPVDMAVPPMPDDMAQAEND